MSKIPAANGGSLSSRAPSRVASISEVAKRAGVSIATVSRIVNGIQNKAAAGTVLRVQKAIADLGYRPHGVGRALRRRESRIVALLAANLANPTMTAIAASAEEALRRAGYVMVLCDTHDRADLQDEYLLEMRAQWVKSVVLLGAVASPQLEAFVAAGEELLFVNRRCPGHTDAPFVGIDNAAAGAEVARFFLGRHISDAAVIHGPLSSSATAERVAAFRNTMARAGYRMSARQIATAEGTDHLAIGYRGMERLLAAGILPKGLFCASDLIAYGAFRRAREQKIDLPRVATVVGFDDNPLNGWVAPWLSSVRVPYAEFGEAIVQSLTAATASPAPKVLVHQLIVRPEPG